MSKHVKNSYNRETGKAEVVIWDKGRRYKGVAVAHESDSDVANQYTGLTIATYKAEIDRNEKKAKACRNEINKLKKEMVSLINKELEYRNKASDLYSGLDNYIEDKAIFAEKLRKLKSKQVSEGEK